MTSSSMGGHPALSIPDETLDSPTSGQLHLNSYFNLKPNFDFNQDS